MGPAIGILEELRGVITGELPITQPLGITVESVDGGRVILRLPLEPNRNVQGTMFAGSLSAAATLSGWAVAWLALRRSALRATLVIQDSALDFLRPVTADCLLVCERADPASEARVLEACRRPGRGRVALSAQTIVGKATAARFRGRYVAIVTPG